METQYSKNMIYKNGLPVIIGENGDHTKVRQILSTGIIDDVYDFGAALITKEIKYDSVMYAFGFELFITHLKSGLSVSLKGELNEYKNVCIVHYQRMKI